MDDLTYRWTNIVELFYTTNLSVDLAHYEIFRAKVGKGDIMLANICSRRLKQTIISLKVLTSICSSCGRLYRQGVGSRLWIRHGRVSISVPAWHITPADVAGRPRWVGVGISQKH